MKNIFGWEVKKLGKVATFINGYPFKPVEWSDKGLPIIRIQNLNNESAKYNYFDGNLHDKYLICSGDILISWSASLGVYEWKNENAYLNQHIFKVVFDKIEINKYYFKYLIEMKLDEMIHSSHGSGMKHITKKDFDNIDVSLHPLPTQHQIVSELDALSEIISKKKQQLQELDKLAQATFYDMFGDPVTNEKGWEVKKLGDIGSFKNGLNYKSSDVGKEVKILGVSDFKSNLKIDDINQLSYIMVDSEPNDDYYLKENDFVFVRSNGSKELVGRCLLLTNVNQKVTFSGFCIRLRLDYSKLNPIFLLHILTNVHFKNNLVHQGRGANISNVNQQMLSEMSIITPPEVIQNNFSKQIESIESQKSLITQSIAEVQQLFDYTMDKYFE